MQGQGTVFGILSASVWAAGAGLAYIRRTHVGRTKTTVWKYHKKPSNFMRCMMSACSSINYQRDLWLKGYLQHRSISLENASVSWTWLSTYNKAAVQLRTSQFTCLFRNTRRVRLDTLNSTKLHRQTLFAHSSDTISPRILDWLSSTGLAHLSDSKSTVAAGQCHR